MYAINNTTFINQQQGGFCDSGPLDLNRSLLDQVMRFNSQSNVILYFCILLVE